MNPYIAILTSGACSARVLVHAEDLGTAHQILTAFSYGWQALGGEPLAVTSIHLAERPRDAIPLSDGQAIRKKMAGQE